MSVTAPREYQHFINGSWRKSESNKALDVLNPATGEILTRVPAGDSRDVDAAVAAAGQAFSSWGKTTPVERQGILLEIANRIQKRARDYAELESLNVGKPIRESANIDIPLAIDHYRYFAGVLRNLQGTTQTVDPTMLHLTLREPLGVVGHILPWNFPLLLAAWKLAPSLAGGNTVVMKPAEQTPVTLLELANDLRDVLPPGVLNVVTGYGPDVGAPLASHPGVRKLSFTGETTTGRLILQYASENIVPATMELGGKSPHIIFPDADVERAIEGVMIGVFLNQGEVCTAGSRLFVHDAIYDRFMEKLVAKVKGLKIGDPMKEDTQLGPIVSREQMEKVLSYIEIGKKEGAALLCGGTRPADPALSKGFFVAPAIFGNVKNKMRIAQEEIFGPVVSVIRWSDYDTMIAEANDIAYGLGAGLWTETLPLAVKTAKALQAGTVWINTYNALTAGAPFGGYKKSGFGRECAFDTLLQYTQIKSLFVSTAEKPIGLY
ncbi:MAG: aldehyde dehydrogenase [Deltaproteobacteria bacterium GWB2_65_81]|nr:MAG: aldehyde dehydrogenase [Deltaproteobacteria bacterium GWA2_65_63]OGP27778.1 MAG: aldehyde dehydrogenase [Deltaproteobacteria bacterium GWB2_65_81]OGP36686.1 MAG: aldehyde dehydrogenase [Deltaproteobacteria bacterium GWC2_66_88]HAM32168.1 aldehyde dehydrogenase [Deltaproteobacteria bacterium]